MNEQNCIDSMNPYTQLHIRIINTLRAAISNDIRFYDDNQFVPVRVCVYSKFDVFVVVSLFPYSHHLNFSYTFLSF